MSNPVRVTSRKRIYRRRRALVFGTLAVLLAGGVYVPTAAAADVPDAPAVIAAPDVPATEAVEPDFPDFGRGAIGAIGFDGVLASSGDQGPFPIASITKVVTALVVLDAKPLGAGEDGPDIEFTDADVQIYNDVLAQNGSLQPVSAGMVLTQRQTMETMLIPSANNYAESLARWAYGSRDAYLTAARAWLDSHQLTDTVVEDANGLSPSNRSTPADLVALGELALADPTVAAIVAMPAAVEPGIGTIENTNQLLGTSGVDGIKTGTTDEAGACLLFSTDIPVGGETVTVVGAILGAADHDVLDDAVVALLASVTPGFHEVPLVHKGDPYAEYSTEWGSEATAVAAESRSVLTWSDTPVTAEVSARPLESGAAGEDIGSVTFTVGDREYEVPLELDASLADPDLWWRVTNPPWARSAVPAA
ncbi:MAG: D-alanyl-D-alanine endopeptidase [Naasia sp.]|uniref:D-alanyl-D-alanine carboxypeptidase family protein n=1 Tax=Naasia sp. TaxID=2546198 RepID=UPI002629D1EB|nr:D-alanyl-D-alanine carboxypeptidase [Naasia sp.]MCU1569784.1 D-alanyl-D-alanine endopeptidase [Naasia sp.]